MLRLSRSLGWLCVAMACGCNFFQIKPQEDPFEAALLAAQPDHEFALYAMGHSLLTQGKYAEAERVFVKFTRTNPDKAAGWTGLGQCELELHHYGQAQEAFEKALALRPDFTNESGLISALILQEQFDSAKTRLEKAFESYGENSALFRLRGDLALAQRNYAQATASYQKSLELDSDQPDIKRRLDDLAQFKADN